MTNEEERTGGHIANNSQYTSVAPPSGGESPPEGGVTYSKQTVLPLKMRIAVIKQTNGKNPKQN
jgi:hypothetical protein